MIFILVYLGINIDIKIAGPVVRYIFILIFSLSFTPSESQVFFRITTDFMIKAKSASGQQQLTAGRVYYDKNVKQIVYEISFPEKEIWVQRDTMLYKIINSQVVSRQRIPTMIDFSVYSLALNGNLADYGLKNTRFKVTKVEKSEGSVISTWAPPAELKKIVGDVLLSNVNQQLSGIVFKNLAGEVVSRQFFRNYTRVKGLPFPQEIVKETIANNQKSYEITTFSNIKINDLSGEYKYEYKIPEN